MVRVSFLLVLMRSSGRRLSTENSLTLMLYGFSKQVILGTFYQQASNEYR